MFQSKGNFERASLLGVVEETCIHASKKQENTESWCRDEKFREILKVTKLSCILF